MPAIQGMGGLTGIAGYQVLIDENSQATPEERSGNTVDPRHANRGEQAEPYSWVSMQTPAGSHGPYGPENQLLGDPEWVWQPGGMEDDDPDFDYTPNTHAAPQPVVLSGSMIGGVDPDSVALLRQQSMRIHASNTGGKDRLIHGPSPLNDTWEDFADNSPGSSLQERGPQQLIATGQGWGTTDRVQSSARQNSYDYDTAHKHRRWATGEIPGNNDWMRPGGRVMRKSLAGPARPAIGPSSPFAGQDLGQTFSVGGAVLLQQPTEYVSPPQPNLAQPVIATINSDGDSGSVEWY